MAVVCGVVGEVDCVPQKGESKKIYAGNWQLSNQSLNRV